MLRSTATALCLLLFTASALAQAPAPDVLIFTNGDQLTGHVERAAAGSVIFKSDMAGELTIPLDKVKELRSGSSFAVLKKGPPSRSNLLGEGNVRIADGSVTVTPSAQAPATIPVKDVGYIVDTPTYDREVDHHIRLTQGWTGSVTGGATIVRSTDNNTSLTAGVALTRHLPTVAYLPPRQRMSLNVIETYGKATSAVIPQTVPPSPPVVTRTSIFHADGEHDWYFTPHLYGLADLSFDHNYSQGLTLQQIYGAGIGWTAIQTARQQLDLKADVHYEKQQLQSGPNPNLIGTIFGEQYHRSLPYKVVFTESGNYIPSWNHPSDYSAMVTGAFVLPTYKRLSTTLSVTDNYLNNPAPFYNQNSFQFVAGVSYALP